MRKHRVPKNDSSSSHFIILSLSEANSVSCAFGMDSSTHSLILILSYLPMLACLQMAGVATTDLASALARNKFDNNQSFIALLCTNNALRTTNTDPREAKKRYAFSIQLRLFLLASKTGCLRKGGEPKHGAALSAWITVTTMAQAKELRERRQQQQKRLNITFLVQLGIYLLA